MFQDLQHVKKHIIAVRGASQGGEEARFFRFLVPGGTAKNQAQSKKQPAPNLRVLCFLLRSTRSARVNHSGIYGIYMHIFSILWAIIGYQMVSLVMCIRVSTSMEHHGTRHLALYPPSRPAQVKLAHECVLSC